MGEQDPQSFEDMKLRLDQIVAAVSDEDPPLEDALGLYEEAVGIGLAASRIMEEGIAAQDDAAQASSNDGGDVETAG